MRDPMVKRLGMRGLRGLRFVIVLLIASLCGYSVPAVLQYPLTTSSPFWLAVTEVAGVACSLSACATLVIVDVRGGVRFQSLLLPFDAGLCLGSLWYALVVIPRIWICFSV
jgi:hypothetical protein